MNEISILPAGDKSPRENRQQGREIGIWLGRSGRSCACHGHETDGAAGVAVALCRWRESGLEFYS